MQTDLSAIAGAQHGVVTVWQACDSGLTTQDLTHLVANGWVRLQRGAYLLPGFEATAKARLIAHQLVQPDLIASHSSAGLLRGVEGVPHRLEFTSKSAQHRRITGGKVWRDVSTDAEIETVDGIAVTTALRTVVDLMCTRGRDLAVVTLDSALRSGLVTSGRVMWAIEACGPRRGVATARCAQRLSDPKCGSVGETFARLLMVDGGLRPRSQVRVRKPNGRVRYVDFEVEGVFIEIEGATYHASRAQHQSDTWRFNEFATIGGHPVLRFTYDDIVNRPQTVLRMIKATIRSHAARQRAGIRA